MRQDGSLNEVEYYFLKGVSLVEQAQKKISTIIGPLYLVASAQGLQGVYWRKQKIPAVITQQNRERLFLNQAEVQIHDYLKGKLIQFTLQLDIQGTEFQKQVWKQLARIPYGQTCSYKDIAKAIENENASRAVGTANGQNPLCLIIPCHRVISSDGSLGGYSGGVEMKATLLSLEQHSSRSQSKSDGFKCPLSL